MLIHYCKTQLSSHVQIILAMNEQLYSWTFTFRKVDCVGFFDLPCRIVKVKKYEQYVSASSQKKDVPYRP